MTADQSAVQKIREQKNKSVKVHTKGKKMTTLTGLKAKEKRCVFKRVLKTARGGACLTSRGSSSHVLGAKAAEARSPLDL